MLGQTVPTRRVPQRNISESTVQHTNVLSQEFLATQRKRPGALKPDLIGAEGAPRKRRRIFRRSAAEWRVSTDVAQAMVRKDVLQAERDVDLRHLD